MNEKVSKTDEISKVLFFDWDPIGIKGLVGKDRYDKNSDEYIVYAREIVSRFSEVPNEDEIFDYLKHACQSRMGMGLLVPLQFECAYLAYAEGVVPFYA